MITIRHETPRDVAAREALLDRAYRRRSASPRRPSACARAACRPRACRSSRTERGRIIGTVRLWNVAAGRRRPALLLGPLAVAPECRSRGIGAALMGHALARGAAARPRAVLLVGDAPYYGRFGFSAEKTGALWLPGPTSGTGCWPANSSPARSTARTG